jgi:hypothetical protein
MIKTKSKKIGSEKAQAALFIVQRAIEQITDTDKVPRTKSRGLKTGRYGRGFYKARKSKTLSKEIRAKILDKLSTPRKSASSLPLSISLGSPRTVAGNAVKGILKNVSKAGLPSILVGGGVASVGIIYLVAKGRINKTDALRHVIKGASGGVTSGIIEIGTLAMLTALSSLPVVARIAVLAGVSLGVKKLWNRS